MTSRPQARPKAATANALGKQSTGRGRGRPRKNGQALFRHETSDAECSSPNSARNPALTPPANQREHAALSTAKPRLSAGRRRSASTDSSTSDSAFSISTRTSMSTSSEARALSKSISPCPPLHASLDKSITLEIDEHDIESEGTSYSSDEELGHWNAADDVTLDQYFPNREDADKDYQVLAVLDFKRHPKKRHLLYRARWKGYPDVCNTWVPGRNFQSRLPIEKFWREWSKIYPGKRPADATTDVDDAMSDSQLEPSDADTEILITHSDRKLRHVARERIRTDVRIDRAMAGGRYARRRGKPDAQKRKRDTVVILSDDSDAGASSSSEDVPLSRTTRAAKTIASSSSEDVPLRRTKKAARLINKQSPALRLNKPANSQASTPRDFLPEPRLRRARAGSKAQGNNAIGGVGATHPTNGATRLSPTATTSSHRILASQDVSVTPVPPSQISKASSNGSASTAPPVHKRHVNPMKNPVLQLLSDYQAPRKRKSAGGNGSITLASGVASPSQATHATTTDTQQRRSVEKNVRFAPVLCVESSGWSDTEDPQQPLQDEASPIDLDTSTCATDTIEQGWGAVPASGRDAYRAPLHSMTSCEVRQSESRTSVSPPNTDKTNAVCAQSATNDEMETVQEEQRSITNSVQLDSTLQIAGWGDDEDSTQGVRETVARTARMQIDHAPKSNEGWSELPHADSGISLDKRLHAPEKATQGASMVAGSDHARRREGTVVDANAEPKRKDFHMDPSMRKQISQKYHIVRSERERRTANEADLIGLIRSLGGGHKFEITESMRQHASRSVIWLPEPSWPFTNEEREAVERHNFEFMLYDRDRKVHEIFPWKRGCVTMLSLGALVSLLLRRCEAISQSEREDGEYDAQRKPLTTWTTDRPQEKILLHPWQRLAVRHMIEADLTCEFMERKMELKRSLPDRRVMLTMHGTSALDELQMVQEQYTHAPKQRSLELLLRPDEFSFDRLMHALDEEVLATLSTLQSCWCMQKRSFYLVLGRSHLTEGQMRTCFTTIDVSD